MTSDEKRFKEQMDGIRKEISRHQKEIVELRYTLSKLIKVCNHSFSPLTKKENLDKFFSETARCLICGEGFGWRCKESPDQCCHYYSQCGEVWLIDGTKVHILDGHNVKNESDDWCIFCGLPEERK